MVAPYVLPGRKVEGVRGSPQYPRPQVIPEVGMAGVQELVTVLLPFTSLCNEIFSSFFLSMSFSKFIFSFFSMEISVFSSALMARIFLLQSSLTMTSLAFRGSRARIFSFWWANQGEVGESLWGHGEQLGDIDPKVTGVAISLANSRSLLMPCSKHGPCFRPSSTCF